MTARKFHEFDPVKLKQKNEEFDRLKRVDNLKLFFTKIFVIFPEMFVAVILAIAVGIFYLAYTCFKYFSG